MQQPGSVLTIFGVHLQTGDPHHVAGAVVGAAGMVVAEHVADVLAEKALDAFAKFEQSLDVGLVHRERRLRLPVSTNL